MLLNNVEVVEEPLAGRPDVRFRPCGRRQALVGGVENALGAFQPCEQRGAPPSNAANERLALRLNPRTLREMLGAKQLAADRTGECLVSVVDDGGKEPGRERAGKGQRWNGVDREWSVVGPDVRVGSASDAARRRSVGLGLNVSVRRG